MKRMMKRLLPVLMAIAPLTICAQKVYELKDISGKVQVNVIVNDKNVEYSVLHDNDVMVAFAYSEYACDRLIVVVALRWY